MDRSLGGRTHSTPHRARSARIRLWDGFEIGPADGSPIGTFVIKNRPALLGWVWDPDLYFGEAFMFGAIEIRGDFVRTLEAAFRALATAKPRRWWLWQSSNDERAARENVHHHYDLHFIGRDRPAPLNPWIRRRIFPGGYPPSLREVSELVLEPHVFSVLDVENLRLHYAKTLEHWLARFNDASDQVRPVFDDTFVRAWQLYLAGSQAAFLTGSMQLFQIVFARGGCNAIPWTRRGQL